MAKFAKQLFVTRKVDGNSKYYLADSNVEGADAENGEEVAIYELKKIKKVTRRTDLI